MHTLQNSGVQASLGWIQHTVRPLLRTVDSFSQADQGHAGRDVCGDKHAGRKPYTGGCFAGPEGFGCALSRAEQSILSRVSNEPTSWAEVMAPIRLGTS